MRMKIRLSQNLNSRPRKNEDPSKQLKRESHSSIWLSIAKTIPSKKKVSRLTKHTIKCFLTTQKQS